VRPQVWPLVDHLAAHARANGVTLLRLETGIHQQAAIRRYERLGSDASRRSGLAPTIR